MGIPRAGTATRWADATELLRQLVVRAVSESVRGSTLGVLWLVLNPLLSLALYVLVFGVLFGGKFGRVENESSISYAIGVYIGLSIVNLINETIGKSTTTLQRHGNLVRKVVFPLELLPLVQVLEVGFKLAVNTALWLAMGCVFGTVLSPHILYLPLIFIPLLGMALGLAWLISALSVYLPDIQQLTAFVTQIIFWSSGVFYSADKVREVPAIWAVLRWNPVFIAIENLREIVLWGMPPDPFQVLYLFSAALVALAVGAFFFSRLRPGFADFL